MVCRLTRGSAICYDGLGWSREERAYFFESFFYALAVWAYVPDSRLGLTVIHHGDQSAGVQAFDIGIPVFTGEDEPNASFYRSSDLSRLKIEFHQSAEDFTRPSERSVVRRLYIIAIPPKFGCYCLSAHTARLMRIACSGNKISGSRNR